MNTERVWHPYRVPTTAVDGLLRGYHGPLYDNIDRKVVLVDADYDPDPLVARAEGWWSTGYKHDMWPWEDGDLFFDTRDPQARDHLVRRLLRGKLRWLSDVVDTDMPPWLSAAALWCSAERIFKGEAPLQGILDIGHKGFTNGTVAQWSCRFGDGIAFVSINRGVMYDGHLCRSSTVPWDASWGSLDNSITLRTRPRHPAMIEIYKLARDAGCAVITTEHPDQVSLPMTGGPHTSRAKSYERRQS